jgi:hypothetical protein
MDLECRLDMGIGAAPVVEKLPERLIPRDETAAAGVLQ